MNAFGEIKVGYKVRIRIPNGVGHDGQEWKEKTGRVVMDGPAGWVLDMGGKWGTPAVCTTENFVRIVRRNEDYGPEHITEGHAEEREAYYGDLGIPRSMMVRGRDFPEPGEDPTYDWHLEELAEGLALEASDGDADDLPF